MIPGLESLTGGGGVTGGDTSSGTGPQQSSNSFANSLLNQIGGFTKGGIVFGASGQSTGGVRGSSAAATATQDADGSGAVNGANMLTYVSLGLGVLALVMIVARR